MSKYLSIDTEATGLEENTHLIQIAFVPVDTKSKKVYTELAMELLVQCPSFEELKPNLNAWVLEHNEGLIRSAHAEGVTTETLREKVKAYMESAAVKEVFQGERPPLLGKTLSALDIPLMRRYLGYKFVEQYFHHHTLDVTCLARGMVDSGILPPGCHTTSRLVRHFKLRDSANHTALSDAVDMGEIYLKLLELLSTKCTQEVAK